MCVPSSIRNNIRFISDCKFSCSVASFVFVCLNFLNLHIAFHHTLQTTDEINLFHVLVHVYPHQIVITSISSQTAPTSNLGYVLRHSLSLFLKGERSGSAFEETHLNRIHLAPRISNAEIVFLFSIWCMEAAENHVQSTAEVPPSRSVTS